MAVLPSAPTTILYHQILWADFYIDKLIVHYLKDKYPYDMIDEMR